MHHIRITFEFECSDVVSVGQFVCFSFLCTSSYFITYTYLVITLYRTVFWCWFDRKIFHSIFLHTVIGCIVPTPPKYGHLVSQNEDSVKFLCQPSFVFPDTFLGSRTLYCTDRNTWDNSLPDCVGMLAIIANRVCSNCLKRLQFLALAFICSFNLAFYFPFA